MLAGPAIKPGVVYTGGLRHKARAQLRAAVHKPNFVSTWHSHARMGCNTNRGAQQGVGKGDEGADNVGNMGVRYMGVPWALDMVGAGQCMCGMLHISLFYTRALGHWGTGVLVYWGVGVLGV